MKNENKNQKSSSWNFCNSTNRYSNVRNKKKENYVRNASTIGKLLFQTLFH